MPYARVGAMPQPNRPNEIYPPGRGPWRNRVQSGMSMEELKRATSLRLANEQGEGQSDVGESDAAVTGPDHPMQYQEQRQYNYNNNPRDGGPSISNGSRPRISQMPPNGSGFRAPPSGSNPYGQTNQPLGSRDYPSYNNNNTGPDGSHSEAHNNYYHLGNNSGGGYGDMLLFPSPPPQLHNLQQTSSTSTSNRSPPQSQSSSSSGNQQKTQDQQPTRMSRHATVLQDRGSFENVHVAGNGSDPNVVPNDGSGYNGWSGGANGSNGSRGNNGSNGKSISPHPGGQKVKGKGGKGKVHNQQPQREIKSPDGRRTPVKDRNLEGHKILYATPNQRREITSATPTSIYSEPPRNKMSNRPNTNTAMSPAYNMHLRVRTPDHGYHTNPKGPPSNPNNPPNYYPKTALHPAPIPGSAGPGGLPGKQSKLPHGLTVQELKEMTRARLAAEAEQGGPDDRAVAEKEYNDYMLQHAESSSVGTQGSSKGSVKSGDQIQQHYQQQQQYQGQAPHGQGQQYQQQQQSQHYVQYRKNSSESNVSARSGPSTVGAPSNDYSSQGMNSQHSYTQGQRMVQHGSQPQLHQPQQYPYPRQHSPSFGSGGQPRPYSPAFGSGQPRQHSPAFGSGPSQFNPNQQHQQPQILSQHSKEWKPSQVAGDAWETASVASTLASEHQGSEVAYPAPFPPPSDSSGMIFNRGRCFSAGAGVPSASFERYLFDEQQQQHQQQQHSQAAYFEAPMSGAANRRRCATMSPPGMSRLYEDRPFATYGDEKERLSIPPLSEPRLRHAGSSSGFNHQAVSFQSFSSSASPQPPSIGAGSAFEPIGKANNSNSLNRPRSPPSLTVERSSKFSVVDRSHSTGSTASIHGDLPSSVAESVLESITGGAPFPVGGDVIGESPFRVVGRKNGDVSSAFRFDQEPGSGSLFSNSGSRSIFSPENSGEQNNILGTNSWGGAESSLFENNEESSHSAFGLSHDFSSLLNIYENNGPALRGRAATAPCFGENNQFSPLLVSRIDPELNGSRDSVFSQTFVDEMRGNPGRIHSDSTAFALDPSGLSPLRHSSSAPISRPPDRNGAVGDSQSFERTSPSNRF